MYSIITSPLIAYLTNILKTSETTELLQDIFATFVQEKNNTLVLLYPNSELNEMTYPFLSV